MKKGTSSLLKPPNEPELITAYYGTVYGIEVFDIINDESFYTGKVKESDSEQMRDLGWTDLEEE